MEKKKVNLKIKHAFKRTMILGAVVCFLLSALTAAGFFDGIELKILDAAYKKRKQVEKRKDIVTIDIDDNAVNIVGRWPWSWDVHAAVVEFLSASQARAVAFVDLDFSKEEPVSFPEESSAAFKEAVSHSLAEKRKADNLLSVIPDYNKYFYANLRESGKACFTPVFKIPKNRPGDEESLRIAGSYAEMHTARKREAIDILGRRIGIPGNPADFLVATDILLPVAGILEHPDCMGFNNIVMDKDGVVRKYPLMVYYMGRLYPSIGLQLAKILTKASEIKVEGGKLVELQGGEMRLKIPVNDRGEMYINWVGENKDTFIHLPFNLVSDFIGFQIAKNELSKYSFEMLQDKAAFDRLNRKLASSRLFTAERGGYIGTVVFVSALAEHLISKEGYDFKDALLAIGLDPKDDLWSGIGMQVYFNNYLLRKYKNSGKVPGFEEVLRGIGFSLTKEKERQFKDAYDLMVYYMDNRMVERMRPLYFEAAKVFVQGRNEFRITPLFFRDKIVFYGLTATGLAAQNATPFSSLQDMLDAAPNALNTILTGNFIKEAPPASKYLISYFYLFAVLLCVLLLSPLQGFLLAFFAAGAHIGIAWFSFSGKGYILPVSQPVFAVFASYISAVAYRYFEEQKERRKVRGMFSTMVSPEVLRIMEENPDRFKLAGEKAEATLFSSDVSGFTTISEGVTSRELADILNIYLTHMSNIIMSYNGYIDKYEGDAIKADFGVPLRDEDHAWKACFSALYQQEELKVIRRMILLKYGVKITARMGINTGIVSAGNMGSEKRMQYTVMGDAVTIAEELEPANKIFDTRIAIGAATCEKAKNCIDARHLTDLVFGRAGHSAPVYELTGWKKEKFLEYWLNKPVPELALESLRKMSPEKVVAYCDFYEQKKLPESHLLADLKSMFAELKGQALECMRINNAGSILNIAEALKSLKNDLKKYEGLYSRSEAPDVLSIETDRLRQGFADEKGEWKRTLLQWRMDLKECSVRLNLLAGKITKEDNDRYVNDVDIIEKSVECVYKRIMLASPDDPAASEMSEHLKELLADKDNLSGTNGISSLSEKTDLLESGINSRLSTFADGLKNRADEYHMLIADLCVASEGRKKVFEIFEEGRKRYLKRDWEGAAGKFREALSLMPGDMPCLKYLEKIEGYKKNPPGVDWTGAWEE